MTTYLGAAWIREAFKVEMSPLGEAVANILGRVFCGIYHLSPFALEKVKWDNTYVIEISYCFDMATVDPDHLTAIVVLSHDEMIRVSVEGVGPGYMRLMFHKRKGRTGDFSERIPTMEDHIKLIRSRKRAI